MSVDEVVVTEDLVSAVKVLDQLWTRWEDSGVDQMPEYLRDAINVVCTITCSDFPTDKRLISLFLACVKLAEEWQTVLEDTEDRPPKKTFFTAVENVLSHLEAINVSEEAPIRSVASLLKEYGNAPQRWNWIARDFGQYNADTDEWSGPFYGRNGIIRQDLIEKEAEKPGSVLPADFQTLDQSAKNARAKSEALRRLAQLQTGLFRGDDLSIRETASVLDMLQEGQFPDVIARVKGIPLSKVIAEADLHGIPVASRDDVLNDAAKASFSRPMDEARGYELESEFDPVFDDDDADDDAEMATEPAVESDPYQIDDATEPEKLSRDELDNFVMQYVSENPEATAIEILQASAAETGKVCTPQAVRASLSRIRG
jgi:hypothetical protein